MRRKAVLLTIRPDNEEMEELIYAQGSDLAATVRQRRAQPDPQYHLGTGKLEEAREVVRLTGATLVIVNAALKPNQIFNLQQLFRGRLGGGEGEDIEVWDRTRLILEIFRERARSPEARLQVELAQLTYDTPLVKEAINLEKKGERQAAMFGGGEYGVNEYFDMMKRRMTRIKRDLDKMRAERGLRRKHRRRGGYHLVSLAGYTNAGKSSLLKALAPAPTLIENRYFSTLSTKTRRAASDKREILVTDTVGFIADLPPWMVDAFHSTLEEIAFADVTLLVVDASDPVEEMARRLKSSLRILWEFDAAPALEPGAAPGPGRAARGSAPGPRGGRGARGGGSRGGGGAANGEGRAGAAGRAPGGGAGSAARFASPGEASFTASRRLTSAGSLGLAPILVVLNKVDEVPKAELEAKAQRLVDEGLVPPDGFVGVSARTGEGLTTLFDRIYALLPDYDLYEVALPQTPATETFLAWLHDETDVLSLTRGNEVHARFEAKTLLRDALERRLAELGATQLVLEPVDKVHPGQEAEAGAMDSSVVTPSGSSTVPPADPAPVAAAGEGGADEAEVAAVADGRDAGDDQPGTSGQLQAFLRDAPP